jgi:tagatose-1,6-bisphosphate aldolase
VPALFRDPIVVTYVDADNTEIAVTTYADVLPRVGENIRIRAVPYVVERIGYDMPEQTISHIWIVCRRA